MARESSAPRAALRCPQQRVAAVVLGTVGLTEQPDEGGAAVRAPSLVVAALVRGGDDDGQLAEAGLAAADGPYGAEAVSARLGLLVLEAER